METSAGRLKRHPVRITFDPSPAEIPAGTRSEGQGRKLF